MRTCKHDIIMFRFHPFLFITSCFLNAYLRRTVTVLVRLPSHPVSSQPMLSVVLLLWDQAVPQHQHQQPVDATREPLPAQLEPPVHPQRQTQRNNSEETTTIIYRQSCFLCFPLLLSNV